MVFGHLGDGNIHLVLPVGDGCDDTHKSIEQIVYAPLTELGGSISAKHGIGLEKCDYLIFSRNAVEIELKRKLKEALEPNSIFNPA